ncbi:DNA cytosine methyltransferase [Roseixanthobacter psychrophilus]|uniref:DNA cytosine methyltransferase n=1 Tax=Roseixanthobacter psychrophilus TaxID=3119917 RepID=UPI003D19EB0A
MNARDWRVWTGSCPCQPFSVSGKRRGFADERHLWPIFRGLIEVGRPPVLFGEQVARAPEWLNLVRGDLVEMGYAVGAIPMEAASADADHFRDRYWFVADRDTGQREHAIKSLCAGRGAAVYDGYGDMAHMPGERGREGQPDPRDSAGPPSNVADRTSGGNRALVNRPGLGWGEGWTEPEFRSRGFTAAVASIDGCQYLECPDGKWRRLPSPGVRWLGTRIPARVDKLRAIGNAIDHRPAAQFIGAYLDTRGR